jgi:hypothetical protein
VIHRRLSEARGEVVRFLKANPFSTEAEIKSACQCTIYQVLRKGMFKNRTVDGVRQWRVVANPQDFVK